MQERPRLKLPDETLGRARDLADSPEVPIDDRNSVVALALDLGCDALVALYRLEIDDAVCSVDGCSSAATALIDGGYRCVGCLRQDLGVT